MADSTLAPVQLGRLALTDQQLTTSETVLYASADLINRLLVDSGVPYTKVVANTTNLTPQGWAYGGATAPPAAPTGGV